ncbi:FtsK/SpoIIIE family protein [Branchiibius hedensis]|uniref:FtsK/SpoIIIE family protein n=1 Tax=Branchiibius hedensis TaxID=672460 RepID=A0A2Y8ZTT6_9MICO|nr:FtsK/SpoIIIE domain-containing protein [Branchiibius hedensis]PWJ27010.1 FtsK/SpoIIIE family protein [Branchiibius hedensis]SSA35821.1 FtsK/SpoIIIE family protein [Branchiibius hedensis]
MRTFVGRGRARALAQPVASLIADAGEAANAVEDGATTTMAASLAAMLASDGTSLFSVPGYAWIDGVDGARDAAEVGSWVSGVGPLQFTVGYARCAGVQVETATSTQRQLVTSSFDAANWAPVVVDFDHRGGFITGDYNAITQVTLQMLALLPAGHCRVRVVDPVQLGKSADFLHRLGDAGESVLGNRIETTAPGFVRLLEELEAHITYVTRKFLQGEFSSLTDFNLAAGEVAEPYRLVLIYDLMTACERSPGNPDPDLWIRLQKIINAGPRCGVFVIGHAAQIPPDVQEHYLDSLLLMHEQPSDDWIRSVFGEVVESYHGEGPIRSVEPRWVTRGLSPLADATLAALRGRITGAIRSADDVVVTPAESARVARAKSEREQGSSVPGRMAIDPDDPLTWWKGNSADGIAARFGRAGARDVAELVFASDTRSNALVAGVPGSGKSVWLHSVVMDLVLAYSPVELELYLVDFKEGVEFNEYARKGLRHARVIAIESDRDFGLSVLENIDREIERRGVLFKASGGRDVNIATYRETTGEAIPRVLLVMDEFQKLFERDDRLATRAGELLDRIIRQGRAFGVHVLLATQTLSGHDGLKRHTLQQVTTRVALRCSVDESRLILAENNMDASLLSRPGEGLINYAGGNKDANVRFQATFWSPDARAQALDQISKLLDAAGVGDIPWVFNGAEPVPARGLADLVRGSNPNRTLALPVGMPYLIGQDALMRLRRVAGGHGLFLGTESWAEVNSAAVAALVDGAEVRFVLAPTDDLEIENAFEEVLGLGATPVIRSRVSEAFNELAQVVRERHDATRYRDRAIVFAVPMLHRMRMLDLTDYANEVVEAAETILKDGPEVGVHLILGVDGVAGLDRRLTSNQLREVGVRVTGRLSREDALRLLDSDQPSGLKEHELYLDDMEAGTARRAQRFERVPPQEMFALLTSATDSEHHGE